MTCEEYHDERRLWKRHFGGARCLELEIVIQY